MIVPLPDGAREHKVVAAARGRSIGVHALSDYRVADGDWPPALVLGFGNLGEGTIERGIAAIGDLLTRDRPGP